MAKTITITNGVGTTDIINGNYTVTADVTGYDSSSILPSTVDVVAGTDSYSFTIAATGTLTLHVTETGQAGGTVVAGATFIRTDSSGNEYGSLVTSDANGDAVFNNVPFADSGAPTIYYKQTASDGNHEFDNTIQNTTLTTSTETIQIQNALGATRTINLTDANYQNLPIDNGTINLSQ